MSLMTPSNRKSTIITEPINNDKPIKCRISAMGNSQTLSRINWPNADVSIQLRISFMNSVSAQLNIGYQSTCDDNTEPK